MDKDKCKGCNNSKGCVTCVDGSELAHYHYEEPVSEDLEKEVRKYAPIYYKDNDISKFASHFANWQKEQMMKNAIEGMVEEPESLWWRIISDDLEGEFVVKNNLHDEDRVKMIIIKEE